MCKLNNTPLMRRYYVHATEQQLYASGVDCGTSVEYVTEKNMFIIHKFCQQATEWIVNETAEWALKFIATNNIEPIELFKHDVIRNEEYAVYVTNNCARRIYTPEIHKAFEAVMMDIGHTKPSYYWI